MNNTPRIEFTDTLPKVIEEHMEKDLVAYESSHGVDVNYKTFFIKYFKNEHQTR
ncbi:MAG TPA: hypothetical protein VFU82_07560 [Gammaproteobacteria bacterium]|nr:hypothetical protein [Gammaproteobacteria bacterium]